MVIEERERPAGALGQTHVLVIGVGEYPWLVGGATPRPVEVTQTMDQLDSPPIAARQFADWWLREYADPERPLGSLALLLSDAKDQNYVRADGTIVVVPHATITAISEAAEIWYQRGQANAEDQMVFYFCGHGLAAGQAQVLLARDYGARAGRPMVGVINYDGFKIGMSALAAKRQLIFIDACRMASEALLRNANDTGDVLVPAGPFPTAGMRQNIYFATLSGRPAYGQIGGPTLFTRAVLRAFGGAGAKAFDDDTTAWHLNTARIAEALEHFASTLADPVYGEVQPAQMDALAPFNFHRFQTDPLIPVYIEPVWYQGTDPDPQVARLTISIGGEDVATWARPWNQAECSWAPNRFVSWLKPDIEYKIRIDFDDSTGASGQRHVVPPYGVIRVDRNV